MLILAIGTKTIVTNRIKALLMEQQRHRRDKRRKASTYPVLVETCSSS
ncbi:predicted protein [Plenodomus lingam JN3]|uniref:Predicted protein n=1 Tax=Leptosphaeria maculans (strain JN3 / isolate v23.1.3 / race Av1-4-5-6-7-8) TaxID=985895 RepID=E5AAK7_LEPMJ|nr:predicted protein [Plenodomus lingam JN3]CBY00698.1 predicted protein [Plenodomus lingam JN3]